jgi:hypothetical protein
MSLVYTSPLEKSARVSQANFILTATVAFDDSYPTGGEDLSALLDEFDASYTILAVQAEPVATYYFGWDRATNKLKAYTAADGNEVGNGTDLAAVTGVLLTVWAE